MSIFPLLAFALELAFFSAILPGSGDQLTRLPDVGDFRPERRLSEYRTYAWNKNQEVGTATMANHLRIINAVQAQMKDRGFRLDTVNPEVRIRYRLQLEEHLQGTATQQRSVWDNANATVQIDFSTEKRARFALQIVEAETNFVLWQAESTYMLGTPDRAERTINEAVADIFKQYPVRE